jgi:hypothetical protein
MINPENSEDVTAIALYCFKLPPPNDIIFNSLLKHIPPRTLNNIKSFWVSLGLTLEAFNTGESNPISSWSLSSKANEYLQKHATFYNVLSIVIFESEHLIKKEADARGYYKLLSLKRSDFVKLWMFADCYEMVWLHSRYFCEGVSVRSFNNRKRNLKRIFNGAYTDDEVNTIFQEMDTEDNKLNEEKLELSEFKSFCLDVFSKYRKSIPSLKALQAVIVNPPSYTQKTAVRQGTTIHYPGRSKKS